MLNSLDSGIAFENPTGSSTNNLILNNTCSFGNNYGIQLIGSSANSNDIINNTCNNNGYYLFTTSGIGIYSNGANFNNVINNTVINNEDYGIQLSSASNNTIQFNNVLENIEGIYLQSNSDNNTILNNSIYNNEANGIYLADADFNIIGNNTVFNQSGSDDRGIFLENSCNNTIITNNISESYYGIVLYPECHNNTISNNSLIKNTYLALYLGQSDDNLISYNSFIVNYGDTYQFSCSGNVFIGNTYIPPSPVLYSFSPNPDDDGNIYIDWSSVGGASRYFVYKNTSVINFADEDLIIHVETLTSAHWDYSLTNDTTYYYAVVAERSGMNSSLSNCESVTVMLFAPQGPPVLEEITPDPDPDGSVFLNWSSVENATRYYVYNDTTEITTVGGMEPLLTATSTNYTHVIPYNITYHYVIVAGNDHGNSSISNCENVTTLLQAPQEAPNLEAFDPNPNYFRNINVNWSTVENATQYHVYKNTSNINSPDEQLRIATVTDTNYTDDITQNGTYYYAVVAANAFGNSTLSNCESVTVQVTPNATILEEITPDPDTDGIIELNWSDVINADNYYIYRNTSSISSVNGMTPIGTVSTSNYTDYLYSNLEYHYVIVAGNAFANSTISNCENVTVELPLNATTLDDILPNPSTTGSIILNWSAVVNADFYLIYRSNSNITTIIGLTQLDNVTTTNYTDNITVNGIYYYVIIAGSSVGNSSLSNCINVTVSIPSNNPPDPPIPGFELLFIILGLICIVSVVYLIKQKRPKLYSKVA